MQERLDKNSGDDYKGPGLNLYLKKAADGQLNHLYTFGNAQAWHLGPIMI